MRAEMLAFAPTPWTLWSRRGISPASVVHGMRCFTDTGDTICIGASDTAMLSNWGLPANCHGHSVEAPDGVTVGGHARAIRKNLIFAGQWSARKNHLLSVAYVHTGVTLWAERLGSTR
jgi:hypothetical protein